MAEPIFDPDYWKVRLERAKGDNLHHAIFRCSAERWRDIWEKHRQILRAKIGPMDRILDAGCGWGRLLDLLPVPPWWYVGVDLSPSFIEKAKEEHPRWRNHFHVGDLRRLPFLSQDFDWAIMVSIRPMIYRNAGIGAWQECERELRRVAKRLLYLEYDPLDEGSVE